MRICYMCLMLLFSVISNCLANDNYIAIVPGDCPNCMGAIELTKGEQNTYVIREEAKIDSLSIRERYSFLKNQPVIYSDSLFELYAVNGRMAISNKSGTLKCPLTSFNRIAHSYFNQWNSDRDKDTITYSNFPIAKLSVSKRAYRNDGTVYLLNSSDNNIVHFDILHDKILDTITLNDTLNEKAYTIFGINDSNGYDYYKHAIEGHIPDALCTIKDIALDKDTLYVSVSNYFFYVGGKNMQDSFLTHFESIAVFKNGHYIHTYVPTNIKERLTDTSMKFYAEPAGIYAFHHQVYTSIYNTAYHEKGSDYAVGVYDPASNKLLWKVKLSKEYDGKYDYYNPFYSNHYCILAKSSLCYDLQTGRQTDLLYFKQGINNNGMFPDYPLYINQDFNVDEQYYNVLYNSTDNIMPYYARISRINNKIVFNKLCNGANPHLIRKINPYDNNDIIQYLNNNAIVRIKVF